MKKQAALIIVLVTAVLGATVALAANSAPTETTIASLTAVTVTTTEPVTMPDTTSVPTEPVPTALVAPAATPAAKTDPDPATASPTPNPTAAPDATPAPLPTPTPLPTQAPVSDVAVSLVLNTNLRPSVSMVGPAIDGGPQRAVGAFVDDEGVATDLVLGELIVATNDPAALQGFLTRNNATVITQIGTSQSDVVDYLVAVPTAETDAALAAARLVEVEPDHTGVYELSESSINQLIAIAASETAGHGLEVSINWIATSQTIEDGQATEHESFGNPFDVDYLRIGGNYDTGVTGAWQLLEQHGRTANKVEVLVSDGGFFENGDFPTETKLRSGSWNEPNPGSCGAPCPTHGTDVSLTAVGQVDNGYGIAGVAGPVATLVAVDTGSALDIFTQLRRTRNIVEEERPDVVNMSFAARIKLFRAASQLSVDRVVGEMVATGAVVFTGAGNHGHNIDGRKCLFGQCWENRLYVPCESKHAICVGGLRTEGAGTWLDEGSNHGTAGGDRSVELYAPFCVQTVSSYSQGNTRNTCGTSHSSPFAAGAAALLLAANPSLDRHQIKSILMDTAHVGGVHRDDHIATHKQRRVNVLDAVLSTLGVSEGPPTVTITSPGNFDEVSITDWIDLRATAHDYKGQPLPVTWDSSIDGDLGSGNDVTAFELTRGNHTITARVTDVNGIKRSDSITLQVRDNPPVMTISWPAPGSKIFEGNDITLIGGSLDPDTSQFLADDEVTWELVRDGQIAVSATGHHAEVFANALTPGDYTVIFRGNNGGTDGVAESILKVKAVPPGEDAPTATILTEFPEINGLYNGIAKTYQLTGIGTDLQDGPIPGSRMRWIAMAEGYQKVLCTGSAWDTYAEPETEPEPEPEGNGFVPGGLTLAAPDAPPPSEGGPSGYTLLTDCSSISVELGLLPQHPVVTHYTIVLEVRDSIGQSGHDMAGLTLNYVTG